LLHHCASSPAAITVDGFAFLLMPWHALCLCVSRWMVGAMQDCAEGSVFVPCGCVRCCKLPDGGPLKHLLPHSSWTCQAFSVLFCLARLFLAVWCPGCPSEFGQASARYMHAYGCRNCSTHHGTHMVLPVHLPIWGKVVEPCPALSGVQVAMVCSTCLAQLPLQGSLRTGIVCLP
jgi:hypothetical protein